jgi:polar amino acid transport system permease protein
MLDLIVKYAPDFFHGMLVTIFVSGTAILLGAVPALALAFGLLSKHPLVRYAANLYRSFWRGTPILVQLLVVFYLLPIIGLSVPPVLAAILALALNTTAFQAEIYRAGLLAIPHGQVEAARMLGIGTRYVRWRIQVPQTQRLVLPPSINQLIVLIKESAALSIITVPELTKIGAQIANETFAVIEPYLAVALLYWLLIELLAALGHWLERKVRHA